MPTIHMASIVIRRQKVVELASNLLKNINIESFVRVHPAANAISAPITIFNPVVTWSLGMSYWTS